MHEKRRRETADVVMNGRCVYRSQRSFTLEKLLFLLEGNCAKHRQRCDIIIRYCKDELFLLLHAVRPRTSSVSPKNYVSPKSQSSTILGACSLSNRVCFRMWYHYSTCPRRLVFLHLFTNISKKKRNITPGLLTPGLWVLSSISYPMIYVTSAAVCRPQVAQFRNDDRSHGAVINT